MSLIEKYISYLMVLIQIMFSALPSYHGDNIVETLHSDQYLAGFELYEAPANLIFFSDLNWIPIDAYINISKKSLLPVYEEIMQYKKQRQAKAQYFQPSSRNICENLRIHLRYSAI
ncbi:MAG: hypothetical protein JJU13_06305 [Balneolaceae bacterium]|nr:hypothetical protein [Balneolaceae bacterium]